MNEDMVDDDVTWFLVAFDKVAGHTEVQEFTDQDSAFDCYIKAEQDPDTRGPRSRVDVVLIGADSLSTVREMYPHYFVTGEQDERLARLHARFNAMMVG